MTMTILSNGTSNPIPKHEDTSKEIHIHRSKVWQFLGQTLGEIKQVAKSGLWRKTKLFDAINRGNLDDVVDQLVLGADVRARITNGDTPLHVAARKGYHEIVSMLLSHGADINTLNHDGQTALYMACANNQELVVKRLLECDARVDLGSTSSGLLPLHVAAKQGSTTIVALLLQYGAQANAAVKQTLLTPLMLATQACASKVVEQFLDFGVSLDAEDQHGNTALHFACSQGDAPTAYLLMSAGADPDMPNIYEETPIEIAIRVGHTHLVHLLDLNIMNEVPMEEEMDHALVHDAQLLASIARNRPELTKVIMKNRVKYAPYFTLGCLHEEESNQTREG